MDLQELLAQMVVVNQISWSLLRWCMGETSAKSMRGAGMEDVIFSGTTNKPEKNLCEVNIEIDNSANEGQAPYKDIEKIIVTRKIER